ncbi:MAG TPA: sialidase family protein [Kofleriaceae bacterium]|nr:sialidase family protein [Kofleriaceae bacterium]
MIRGILIGILAIPAAGCDRSPSSPPPSPPPSPSPAPAPARTISIDPPAAPGATAPNLTAAADRVLATWLEPTDAARKAHRLRLAQLTAAGWGSAVTIAEGAAILANWADVPSIARQDDGVLVAHWAETAAGAGHAYGVVLARSTDGGATWRRLGAPHHDNTPTEHGFVSLVPDGDAVLALWLDGRATADTPAGATALRAARVGAAIGAEELVDARVCDCCSTSAARTADGPAVIYRDRGADELRDPSIARRLGGAWSAPRAVHVDGWQIAGCPVNGPALAASGREVVAAWYTLAGQAPRVRVAFSADAGATFDPPIDVDAQLAASPGARAPIGRIDVALDRPGEALVTWIASAREDGRLLIRRVARDRRRGPELELAAVAASREGGFPRLELLGPDLVVAWVDTRAKQLRAARLPRADVPAVAVAAP